MAQSYSISGRLDRPLVIATRASRLALVQAQAVRSALLKAHHLEETDVTLMPLRTSGDAVAERPLRDFGGKGLFVKEVEQALAEGKADMAVHSMKDVPATLPQGLRIAAYLRRAAPTDMFLERTGVPFAKLKKGARLGTSSLRRQALALRLRPDLQVVVLRGSVETRLDKLRRGEIDGMFLARAGLERLNLKPDFAQEVDISVFPPAIGQGAIGIETRDGDDRVNSLLAEINDGDTHRALTFERAFLEALGGSCHTPVAGLAVPSTEGLSFSVILLSPDGKMHQTMTCAVTADSIEALIESGHEWGRRLRAQCDPRLIAAAGLESHD